MTDSFMDSLQRAVAGAAPVPQQSFLAEIHRAQKSSSTPRDPRLESKSPKEAPPLRDRVDRLQQLQDKDHNYLKRIEAGHAQEVRVLRTEMASLKRTVSEMEPRRPPDAEREAKRAVDAVLRSREFLTAMEGLAKRVVAAAAGEERQAKRARAPVRAASGDVSSEDEANIEL